MKKRITKKQPLAATTPSNGLAANIRTTIEEAARVARLDLEAVQRTGDRFSDRFLDVARIVVAVEKMMQVAGDDDLRTLRCLADLMVALPDPRAMLASSLNLGIARHLTAASDPRIGEAVRALAPVYVALTEVDVTATNAPGGEA